MEAAGIPCARFSLEDSGFEAVAKNTVRVIEITKLVEEKKGSGVSVPLTKPALCESAWQTAHVFDPTEWSRSASVW